MGSGSGVGVGSWVGVGAGATARRAASWDWTIAGMSGVAVGGSGGVGGARLGTVGGGVGAGLLQAVRAMAAKASSNKAFRAAVITFILLGWSEGTGLPGGLCRARRRMDSSAVDCLVDGFDDTFTARDWQGRGVGIPRLRSE